MTAFLVSWYVRAIARAEWPARYSARELLLDAGRDPRADLHSWTKAGERLDCAALTSANAGIGGRLEYDPRT